MEERVVFGKHLRWAQQVSYKLKAFDPAYSQALLWCRAGWQLPRSRYERRELTRLRWLIRQLAAAGLPEASLAANDHPLHVRDDLARLPVLTRDRLQSLLPQLKQLHSGKPGYYLHCSGGSTGQPVHYYRYLDLDRACGGFRAEVLRAVGWRPGIPRICLWGNPELAAQTKRGQTWFRQWLRLTSVTCGYVLDEHLFRSFLDIVRANPQSAVYGYVSLLTECASWMIAARSSLPAGHIKCLWTSAEVLQPAQRQLITQAFGCRAYNLYGSREMESIAIECAHGVLHICPRYIVEAVDQGTYLPLPAGSVGTLLLTDLFNCANPFIRYEIGDIGSVSWIDCACGRSGYALLALQGRLTEQISLPSGRRISSLLFGTHFKITPAVRHYQTVRLEPACFEIRYVGEELPEFLKDHILLEVRQALEGARVKIVRVPMIEAAASGKLIHYIDLTRAAPVAAG